MKDVAPCPHCGASMVARNAAGDIVCAYCDAVIAYHEVPALWRVDTPPPPPLYEPRPSLSGTTTIRSPGMPLNFVDRLQRELDYGERMQAGLLPDGEWM